MTSKAFQALSIFRTLLILGSVVFIAQACSPCYDCEGTIHCVTCIKEGEDTVVVCSDQISIEDRYYFNAYEDSIQHYFFMEYTCTPFTKEQKELIYTCENGPQNAQDIRTWCLSNDFTCERRK